MRSVRIDVPTRIRSGSPRTSRTTCLTTGSNRPTSIMMLKNRIANSNITAVGASAVTPSSIIGPISARNPPRSANAMGTRMSAVRTDIRFVMISAMKTVIMPNARRVSMGYLSLGSARDRVWSSTSLRRTRHTVEATRQHRKGTMTISSEGDLAGMRRVGQLVARTIAHMRAEVRPGMTTAELDGVGERFARAEGAQSAPQLTYNFPGFTCLSVNDEIVHGIPGTRVLSEGDVVKLDVTLELDGFMADSAVTVVIPPVSAEARALQRAARIAFNRGLAVARAGQSLRDVGRAVEAAAKREG